MIASIVVTALLVAVSFMLLRYGVDPQVNAAPKEQDK